MPIEDDIKQGTQLYAVLGVARGALPKNGQYSPEEIALNSTYLQLTQAEKVEVWAKYRFYFEFDENVKKACPWSKRLNAEIPMDPRDSLEEVLYKRIKWEKENNPVFKANPYKDMGKDSPLEHLRQTALKKYKARRPQILSTAGQA